MCDSGLGTLARQQLHKLFRVVRDDQVGPRALDGNERLEHRSIVVQPAVAGGGFEHRVFAADLVRDERDVDRTAAIIKSMTPAERQDPTIINGSRRARIAKGSGVEVSAVKNLVERFFEARKMMSRMAQGGGMPGMPGIPGMGGGPGRQKKQQKKPSSCSPQTSR